MDLPDISLHPGGIELTLKLAEKAELKTGEKLLDIGCGTGCSLASLAENFGIVPFGTDISEKTVAVAGALHPGISFTCANACSLPFEDASFDAVLMECVITLLDDPAAALSEAVRILKPGGRLILSALVNTGQTDAKELVSDGLLQPESFRSFAKDLGLETVFEEDYKNALITFIAESIFEYGSLEERIRAESAGTGAYTLDCRIKYDPKKSSYAGFVLKKF